MSAGDIGIDLGTASVLVYVKGKGIVLCEPSVVAVDKSTGKILAIGEDAQKMLGRTPGNIIAVRPLRDGVISDYEMTEKMIKEFIHKVLGFRLFKPNVVICVPSIITVWKSVPSSTPAPRPVPGRSISSRSLWLRPSALALRFPSPTAI